MTPGARHWACLKRTIRQFALSSVPLLLAGCAISPSGVRTPAATMDAPVIAGRISPGVESGNYRYCGLDTSEFALEQFYSRSDSGIL
jgi:hypothetical protein